MLRMKREDWIKQMSKVVRNQLLQTIKLLQQGTKAVRSLIGNGRTEDCLDLLEDCQNLATTLGMRIEKLYGEGTATVSALEEYCEDVYQVGICLQEQDAKRSLAEYDVLCGDYTKVQETFESEFPDKMEVVFLPYKASMWDALESVWMAAGDDENCEAYVIPIPYYTLDSEHNFKEFIYEGGLYPSYVPVIDYKEYDLELRHPDKIFVHNPYDEFNTVTSVAPEFYLKKIKDYTEQLVYIPYFVLDEIDPSNQMTINRMKHFCFLPGTMYADQVILQSEDMRTIYINEFIKASEERGLKVDREQIEKKFLGLGSPKFDKVLHTRKENLNIPEDWLKIIEKPDGTWKKIIFYNTSINALLKYDEQMLVKMKDVFRIFKENREEIALLWRPHPLIKDTIESMRPHLWKEYQNIVQQYKDEGWGIYDDTADLDRAIVLSDAYYGDPSSVVQVYQQTGKKIYLQDVTSHDDLNIEKKTGRILTRFIPSISFTTRYKDSLYFMASDFNGLFSIELKNGETRLIGTMDKEVMEKSFLGNAFALNGFLIICPFNFNKIHIWDIENGKEIPIDDHIQTKNDSAFLQRMVSFDSRILFIPSRGERGLIFDFCTNSVIDIVDIKREYEEKIGKKYDIFTIDGGYQYQNHIYFSVINTNFICEYSIEKNRLAFIELDISDQLWMSAGIRENIYLLGKENVIYVWNIKSEKIVDQCYFDLEDERDLMCIQDKAIVEDNIYFMSPRSTWGITYFTTQNQAVVDGYDKLFGISIKEDERYHFSSQDDEGIIYFISNQNNLAKVDITNKSTTILPLKFDFDQLEQFWERHKKDICENNGVIGRQIMQSLVRWGDIEIGKKRNRK